MTAAPILRPTDVASADRRPLAGRVAAALLLAAAGFELALAVGAPWGALAWGGSHAGVLPVALRAASAVSVPVYVALGLVALGRLGRGRLRRVILRAFSVYFGLGVLLNAASPSWLETLVWVPMTLATAVSLWLASRPQVRV